MRSSSVLLALSAFGFLALSACQDFPLQPTPSRAPVTRGAPTQPVRSIAVVTGVTLVDLGPALRANGINDSGYVVGQSVRQLAAVWSPSGAMQEIRATCPPPCWPYPAPGCDPLASSGCATNPQHDVPSEATAIDNEGRVVGYYRYDERYYSNFRGGFLWSAARGFTDIWPHHDGTLPYAINDSGQIAGNAVFPSFCCGHAFRRSAAGMMTDLGTVGGGNSWAKAMNDQGDVVGVSPSPSGQGILWPASGGAVPLGGLWELITDSDARGINDAGVVVGRSYVGYPTGYVAFRWTQADGMRQLPGPSLTANAVNRDGYIVGFVPSATSSYPHAGLWTPDGDLIDLGSLGRTSEATAINSRLQVAGYSVDAAGVTHAVRWDVTVLRNRPPVANAGGPYAGSEGSPITFDGSASDPDGDALTLSWSFGDGSTATGSAPSHTYADNGSYTVVLTATDPQGATATSSAIATVANAAPSVQVVPPTPIVSGASFTLHASFADPGVSDMPWRYDIDWGTGTPTTGSTSSQSDPLVAESPRYCAPGAYTVRASVTDKDGGVGSAARTITVARIGIGVDVLAKKVNARSKGTLPVAVLGSAAVDARQVDVSSVLLGTATDPGVPVDRRPNGRFLAETRDVNGDGIPDLVLHFAREALGARGLLTPPATELVLLGQLTDGCRQVSGSDVVQVLGKKR